jgi:dephospho-CoA kinase
VVREAPPRRGVNQSVRSQGVPRFTRLSDASRTGIDYRNMPWFMRLTNHGVYLAGMLRIGLTGGIGSGKSTVAKIFAVLGIPVYYADAATRRLMNEDPDLVKEIIRHFGEKSYIDRKLNRPYIASIVFNDAEKLALLNAITHPATIADANKWIGQQTAPYIIKEAALIFESGSAEHLDAVIGVFAPAPLRIKRTMDRDQVTQEEVKKRMERQINEELKMKLCDHIIVNDEQQLVVPQVMALHNKFLTLT